MDTRSKPTNHTPTSLGMGLNIALAKQDIDPLHKIMAVRSLEMLCEGADYSQVTGNAIKLKSDLVNALSLKEIYNKVVEDGNLGLAQEVSAAISEGQIYAIADRFVTDVHSNLYADLQRRTASALDQLAEIGLPQDLDQFSEYLAAVLGAAELESASAVYDNLLGVALDEASQVTVDSLFRGVGISSEQAALLNSLLERGANEVLKLIKVPVDPQAIELVSHISKLEKLTGLEMSNGAIDALHTYSALATCAARLIKDDALAETIQKTVAFAQAGVQIYQCASVLFAATGWGAAIAAVGMLGGSLNGLSGGNPDNSAAILAAIAGLKKYLEEQFKALNERLDIINGKLDGLSHQIEMLDQKADQLLWAVTSLEGEFRKLYASMAINEYALLEEIDAGMEVEWASIRDSQAKVDVLEIVKFKGFFASRSTDAFDPSRIYTPKPDENVFDTLRQFLRMNSVASGSIAGLLAAALHRCEDELLGMGGNSLQARIPVNTEIALSAVECYWEVHQRQKMIEPSKLNAAAPRIADLTRDHVLKMRRALRCVVGFADVVRPGSGSKLPSTLDILMAELKRRTVAVENEFTRFEWFAQRQYILDCMEEPSRNVENSPNFLSDWDDLRTLWGGVIEVSVPPHQVTSSPFNFSFVADDAMFGNTVGKVPALFCRLLPGVARPANYGPTKLLVEVVGTPVVQAMDAPWPGGLLAASYSWKFTYYGSEFASLTSPSQLYQATIRYFGYFQNSQDTIWSRILNQPEFYRFNAPRQWQHGLYQYNVNGGPSDAMAYNMPASPWGELTKRLYAANNALRQAILSPAANDVTSLESAIALCPEMLEPILSQLLPVKSRIVDLYLVKHRTSLDHGPASLLAKALGDIENLLTTIRGVLFAGMPAAYHRLDVLHALYDGSPSIPGQLRLPYRGMLQEPGWSAFKASIETELKRTANQPNDGSDASGVDVKAPASASDTLPYRLAIRKGVVLLERCIRSMRNSTDETGLPFRVTNALHLLDTLTSGDIGKSGALRIPEVQAAAPVMEELVEAAISG